ncbi:hypothetical protein CHS0354_000663 [Potamilus streckersoni]|uniref:Uncharacterized protein n=1 Tax=Potamilus streckersoni TaxID=2493646 RepID=A0AAE0T7R0_9BIVA|nr:hypothetical protein CHS0354_000663 [Potamilus streckersoni]
MKQTYSPVFSTREKHQINLNILGVRLDMSLNRFSRCALIRRIVGGVFVIFCLLLNYSVLYGQTKYRKPSGKDIKINQKIAVALPWSSGMVDMAVDTVNNKLYVPSFGTGNVFRFDATKFFNNSRDEMFFGGGAWGTRRNLTNVHSVALDKEGNLYATQMYNIDGAGDKDRIVRYDKAYLDKAGGDFQDAVFGQGSFQETGVGLNPTRFHQPMTCSVDDDFNIYVGDRANYRIVKFLNANKVTYLPSAVKVLGQASMNTNTSPSSPSRSRFTFINGLKISSDGNNLYVADRGNSRFLIFRDVKNAPDGANASVVIGQPNFETENYDLISQDRSYSVAIDEKADRLYLAMKGGTIYQNNNVLVFVDTISKYKDGAVPNSKIKVLANYSEVNGFPSGSFPGSGEPHGLVLGRYGRVYMGEWSGSHLKMWSPIVKLKVDETTIRSNVVVGDTFSVVVKVVWPDDLDTYAEAMDSIEIELGSLEGNSIISRGMLSGSIRAKLVPGQREVRVHGLIHNAPGSIRLTASVANEIYCYLSDTTRTTINIQRYDLTSISGLISSGSVTENRDVTVQVELRQNGIRKDFPLAGVVQIQSQSGVSLTGITTATVNTGDSRVEIGPFQFTQVGSGRNLILNYVSGATSLGDGSIANITVTSSAGTPTALRIVPNRTKIINGDTVGVTLYSVLPGTNGIADTRVVTPTAINATVSTAGGGTLSLTIPVGSYIAKGVLTLSYGGMAAGSATAKTFTVSAGGFTDGGSHVTVYESITDYTQVGYLDSASVVVGQSDFTSNGAGLSQNTLNNPRALAIDSVNGKLYVADHFNHRVLRYSLDKFENGGAAEMVFGQPNFTSNVLSGARMSYPNSVAVDPMGNLYVLDNSHTPNNGYAVYTRIVRYDKAFAKTTADLGADGVPRDVVIGQGSLTSFTTTPNFPSQTMIRAYDIDCDKHGNLYVADAFNNRVLRFTKNEIDKGVNGYFPRADLVLGQSDFASMFTLSSSTTTQVSTSNPSSVFYPGFIQLGGSTVNLGNSTYRLSDVSGMRAVLGGAQIDDKVNISYFYNSTGATRVTQFVSGGEYWIKLVDNGAFVKGVKVRIDDNLDGTITFTALESRYLTGTDLSMELLAFQFLSHSDAGTGYGVKDIVITLNAGVSIVMNGPFGVAVDKSRDVLYVAQHFNNNVLRFDNLSRLSNGAKPSAVLGQPNFSSFDANSTRNGLAGPMNVDVDSRGTIYISERSVNAGNGNSRVIVHHNAFAKSNGAQADGIIGSNRSFTSQSTGVSRTQFALDGPHGVVRDNGREIVFAIDKTNNRILGFTNGLSLQVEGMPAEIHVGQEVNGVKIKLKEGANPYIAKVPIKVRVREQTRFGTVSIPVDGTIRTSGFIQTTGTRVVLGPEWKISDVSLIECELGGVAFQPAQKSFLYAPTAAQNNPTRSFVSGTAYWAKYLASNNVKGCRVVITDNNDGSLNFSVDLSKILYVGASFTSNLGSQGQNQSIATSETNGQIGIKNLIIYLRSDVTEYEYEVPAYSSESIIQPEFKQKTGLIFTASATGYRNSVVGTSIKPLTLLVDQPTYEQGRTSFTEGDPFLVRVRSVYRNQTTGQFEEVSVPNDVSFTLSATKNNGGIPLSGTVTGVIAQGSASVDLHQVIFKGSTSNLRVAASATGYDTVGQFFNIAENFPVQLRIKENYDSKIYVNDRYPITIISVNNKGNKTVVKNQNVDVSLRVKNALNQVYSVTDLRDANGQSVATPIIPVGEDSLVLYALLPTAIQQGSVVQSIRYSVSPFGELGGDDADDVVTVYPGIPVPFTSSSNEVPDDQILNLGSSIAFGKLKGIAIDNTNRKVYVSSSTRNSVYRYSLDNFYKGSTPETVIGQTGVGLTVSAVDNNKFTSPTALALDKDNNLYVVDSLSHRVMRFPASSAVSSRGLAITADRVFGQSSFFTNSTGSGMNQLNKPRSVAVDGAGNVFVADASNKRVLVYFASTVNQASTGIVADREFRGFDTPSKVLVDSEGTLFVADLVSGSHVVYVLFSPTTKSSGTNRFDKKMSFSSIWDMSVDRENRLYVSTNTGVLIYNYGSFRSAPTGHNPDVTISNLNNLRVIGVDGTQRLYAWNGDSLVRYAKDVTMSTVLKKTNLVAGESFSVSLNFSSPLDDNVEMVIDTVSTTTKGYFVDISKLTVRIPKGTTSYTFEELSFSKADPLVKIIAKSKIKQYKSSNELTISFKNPTFKFLQPPTQLTVRQRFNLQIQLLNQETGVLAKIPENVTLHIALHGAGSSIPAGSLQGSLQVIFGAGQEKVDIANLIYSGSDPIRIKINPITNYNVDTTNIISFIQGIPQKISFVENYRKTVVKGDVLQLNINPSKNGVAIPVISDESFSFWLQEEGGGLEQITGADQTILDGGDNAVASLTLNRNGRFRVIVKSNKSDGLISDTTDVISVINNLDDIYQNGQNAAIVLGQVDFVTGGSNTGGVSASSLSRPMGILADTASLRNVLYVSDEDNKRVVRYSLSALGTNASANGVFGQSNKSSVSINIGLNQKLTSPRGMDVDRRNGRLFIADSANNRVVWFDNAHLVGDGPIISGVLGQSFLTSTGAGSGLDQMNGPTDVKVDLQGNVYVADKNNNRILVFNTNSAISSGMAPSVVLGRSLFDLNSVAAGTSEILMSEPAYLALDNKENRLYVADQGNNRILRFDNVVSKSTGSAADGVIGQADFISNVMSASAQRNTIGKIEGLSFFQDRLFVSDSKYNRVLCFNLPHIKSNQPFADQILGQSNFTSSGAQTTVNGLYSPSALFITGSKIPTLYVADSKNNRVHVYKNALKLKVSTYPLNPNEDPTGNVAVAGRNFFPTVAIQVLDENDAITTFPTGSVISLSAVTSGNQVYHLNGSVSQITQLSQNKVNFINVKPTKGGRIRLIASSPGFVSDTTATIQVDGLSLEFLSASYSVTQGTNFGVDVKVKDNSTSSFTNLPADTYIKLDTFMVGSAGPVKVNVQGMIGKTFSPSLNSEFIGNFSDLLYEGSTSQIGLRASADGFTSGTTLVNILATEPTHLRISETYRKVVNQSEEFELGVISMNANGRKLAVSNDNLISVTVQGEVVPVATATLVRGTDSVSIRVRLSLMGSNLLVVTATNMTQDVTNESILVISNQEFQNYSLNENAEDVIGKKSFTDNTTPSVSKFNFGRVSAVVVDTLNSKVYVADQTNNRVLRYSRSKFVLNGEPEIVIGQVDFNSNISGTTRTTLSQPSGLAVNSRGDLYVSDFYNNRILRFNSAHLITLNNAPADELIGQTDFSVSSSGTSATSLNNPSGVAIDEQGNVFVSDLMNNRVLKYNQTSSSLNSTASVVFGQNDFTSHLAGTSSSKLRNPSGITVKNGALFVADRQNNRVLKFNSTSTTNGSAATVVLGKSTFTSYSVEPKITASNMRSPSNVYLDSKNRLYVSEYDGNRVLRFYHGVNAPSGERADLVFGQNSFLTDANGTAPNKLSQPSGMFIDDYGRLFLADGGNGRVLRFGPSIVTKGTLSNTKPYAGQLFNVVASINSKKNNVVTPLNVKKDDSIVLDTAVYGSIRKRAISGTLTNVITVGGSSVTLSGLSYPTSGRLKMILTSNIAETDTVLTTIDPLKIRFTNANRRQTITSGTAFTLNANFETMAGTQVAFPDNNVEVKLDSINAGISLIGTTFGVQGALPGIKPSATVLNGQNQVTFNNVLYTGNVPLKMVASGEGLVSDTILGSIETLLATKLQIHPIGQQIEQGEPFDITILALNKNDVQANSIVDERIRVFGLEGTVRRELSGNVTGILLAGQNQIVLQGVSYRGSGNLKIAVELVNTNTLLKGDTTILETNFSPGTVSMLDIVDISTARYPSKITVPIKIVSTTRYGVRGAIPNDMLVALLHGVGTNLDTASVAIIKGGTDSVIINMTYNPHQLREITLRAVSIESNNAALKGWVSPDRVLQVDVGTLTANKIGFVGIKSVESMLVPKVAGQEFKVRVGLKQNSNGNYLMASTDTVAIEFEKNGVRTNIFKLNSTGTNFVTMTVKSSEPGRIVMKAYLITPSSESKFVTSSVDLNIESGMLTSISVLKTSATSVKQNEPFTMLVRLSNEYGGNFKATDATVVGVSGAQTPVPFGTVLAGQDTVTIKNIRILGDLPTGMTSQTVTLETYLLSNIQIRTPVLLTLRERRLKLKLTVLQTQVTNGGLFNAKVEMFDQDDSKLAEAIKSTQVELSIKNPNSTDNEMLVFSNGANSTLEMAQFSNSLLFERLKLSKSSTTQKTFTILAKVPSNPNILENEVHVDMLAVVLDSISLACEATQRRLASFDVKVGLWNKSLKSQSFVVQDTLLYLQMTDGVLSKTANMTVLHNGVRLVRNALDQYELKISKGTAETTINITYSESGLSGDVARWLVAELKSSNPLLTQTKNITLRPSIKLKISNLSSASLIQRESFSFDVSLIDENGAFVPMPDLGVSVTMDTVAGFNKNKSVITGKTRVPFYEGDTKTTFTGVAYSEINSDFRFGVFAPGVVSDTSEKIDVRAVDAAKLLVQPLVSGTSTLATKMEVNKGKIDVLIRSMDQTKTQEKPLDIPTLVQITAYSASDKVNRDLLGQSKSILLTKNTSKATITGISYNQADNIKIIAQVVSGVPLEPDTSSTVTVELPVTPVRHVSQKNGLWTSKDTWDAYIVPRSIDTVEIRHDVELTANTEIHVADVKVGKLDFGSGTNQLKITSDLKMTNVATLDPKLGTLFYSSSSGTTFTLPTALTILNNLKIENAKLRVNADLTINNEFSVVNSTDSILMNGNRLTFSRLGTANTFPPSISKDTRLNISGTSLSEYQVPSVILKSMDVSVNTQASVKLLGNIEVDDLVLGLGALNADNKEITVKNGLTIGLGTLIGTQGEFGYKLKVSQIDGTTPIFQIPAKLRNVNKLELSREKGAEFEVTAQNLSLFGMDLKLGNLNVKSGSLNLTTLSFTNLLSEIIGTNGVSGYRVVYENGLSMKLPPNMKQVNKLIIKNQSNGITQLMGDLVVLDTLSVTNGTLDRQTYGLVARKYSQGTHNRISPLLNKTTKDAGRAVQLTGSSFLTALNSSNLDFSNNQFTIEAWVKRETSTQLTKYVLSKFDAGTGFGLAVRETGQMEIKLGGQVYVTNPTSRLLMQKDEWYHIAGTYNGGTTFRCYVNGVQTDTFTVSQISVNPIAVRIGEGWKGTIDEVRLWNKEVSQFEIKQNMHSQLLGTESNLVGYYRFDKGYADTVYDYSISKAYLTGIGTTSAYWVRSNAQLTTLLPAAFNIETGTLTPTSGVATLQLEPNSKMLELNTQDQANIDSIRAIYRSKFSASYSHRLPSSIDSLKMTAGYWELIKLGQENNLDKVFFKIDLANLNLGTFTNNDKRLLMFIYRFSPNDAWKTLGINYVNGVTSSSRPLVIRGKVEIALGVRNPSVQTIASGNWSDENIWLNGVRPTTADNADIKHQVVLDAPADVRGVIIQGTTARLRYQGPKPMLTVRDTIKPSTEPLILNGGFPLDMRFALGQSGGTKKKFLLPHEITRISMLRVEQRQVIMQSGLTVSDTLFIKTGGSLWLKGKTLILNNELMVDDGSDGIESEKGMISVAGQGAKLSWPSRLEHVDNLSIARANGIQLLSNLIVKQGLFVNSGTLYRGNHGVLVKKSNEIVRASMEGRIIPKIQYDSTKGIRAFSLTSNLTVPSLHQAEFNEDNKKVSIEAWVKVTDLTTGVNILSKLDPNNSTGYQLKVENREVVFTVNGANTVKSDSAKFAISGNVWHHIAATRNQDTLRVFINGVLVGSNVVALLGASSNSLEPIIGGPKISIDELRVWKIAKREIELRDSMNTQVSGNFNADLVAHYAFNEGWGDSTYSNTLKPMPVHIVGKGSYIDSRALISTVSNAPTLISKINISSFASKVDFAEIRGVSIKNIGAIGGSLQLGYALDNPNLFWNGASSEIKTLLTTSGYWEVVTPDQNKPTVTQTSIEFDLNDNLFKNFTAKEFKSMSILYRKNTSSSWKNLGGEYLRTDLQKPRLLAQQTLNLEGYTQIALGLRQFGYLTKNNGLWSNGLTWTEGTPPKTNNNPLIHHLVELNSNETVATVEVGTGGGLTARSGSVLTITEQFETTGTGIVSFEDGSSLKLESTENMTIPEGLSSVYDLEINTKDTVTLSSPLEIRGVLRLKGGVVFVLKGKAKLIFNGSSPEIQNATVKNENVQIVVKKSILLPMELSRMDSLIVDMSNSNDRLTIIRDLIIYKDMTLKSGGLNRGLNSILYYNLNISQGFVINPPLAQDDSTYAVGSVKLIGGLFTYAPRSTGRLDVLNLTVQAWVKNNSGTYAAFLSKGNSSAGWELGIESDGKPRFTLSLTNGTKLTVKSESFTLKPNRWFHVSAVVDQVFNQMILYVNGIEVGQTMIPEGETIKNATSEQLKFGSTDFKGSIDEVRIWQKVLTQQQIKNDFVQQLSGEESELISYYKMNESVEDSIYDNSLSQIAMYLNGAEWERSGALVSSSGNRETSKYFYEYKTTTPSDAHTFGNTMTISGDVISDSKFIVSYFNTKARSAVARNPLIQVEGGTDNIVSLGYWVVTNTSAKKSLNNAKIRFSLKNVSFLVGIRAKDLTIVIRKSSGAKWTVLGSQVINDEDIITPVLVDLSGEAEVAIALKTRVSFIFAKPTYGANPTDIVSNIVIITDLDPNPSQNTIEWKIIGTTDKEFKNVAFETDFKPIISNNGLVGSVQLPVKTATTGGIEVGKSYYLRGVLNLNGTIDTVSNTSTISVPIDNKNVKIDGFDLTARDYKDLVQMMPNERGLGAQLMFTGNVQQSSYITVTTYVGDVGDKTNLGANVFLAPFYWTIEGNEVLFNDGRLYFPLKEIYNLLSDSTSLKFFRRVSSLEPWNDVTSGIETINGVRYFSTKFIQGFSDYVIGIDQKDPKLSGLFVTLEESNSKKYASKVRLNISGETGASIVNVNLKLSRTLNFDNPIFNSSVTLSRNPIITKTSVLAEDLEKNKAYYYIVEFGSSVNNMRTDTGIVVTDVPEISRIDTVKKTYYKFQTSSPAKLSGGLYLQADFTERVENEVTLSTQKFLRQPPELANLVLPKDIQRINPLYWTLRPTRDELINEKIIKVVDNNLRIKQDMQPNMSVGILASALSQKIDFTNIVWLKRNSVSNSWDNIGGQQVTDENGITYFVSNEINSDLYGDYALGTKLMKETGALFSIKNFGHIASGDKRLSVQWRSENENASLLGFEVVRVNVDEEKIVSTFTNNKVLTSKKLNPSFYSVVDVVRESISDADIGNLTYKIRYYDNIGNIYENDAVSVKEARELTFVDSLGQNYPNPFNNQTIIEYGISTTRHVLVKVFDLLGREVATLVDAVQERGRYRYVFDAQRLPSGVYFYRIKSGRMVATRKMEKGLKNEEDMIPVEKRKQLDMAIAEIEKQFGKGSIMKLGDDAATQVQAISTGSNALDFALGVGGFPKGRIVEIYGPESSGKTTISMHAVAESQKAGGVAAFIDAEHAFDPSYAKKLGIDIKLLLVSQPESGEQALSIADALVRSAAVDIIVVDSVAALVPQAELEGEMGDTQVGLQARLMSRALRKLTGIISKSNCVLIFINQLRDKIGVMYGSPETTTGGKALKFYASVRLDIRRIGQIKEGTEIIGNRTKVKVVKNKVAPPFKEVEFDIIYGEGISRVGEVIDLAVEFGIIRKSGSWFSYKDEKLGQGREAVKLLLKGNKELFDELQVQVRAQLNHTDKISLAISGEKESPLE